MKLLNMTKKESGSYLKHYTLTYENRAGKEKKYDMVSYNDMTSPDEIGREVNGVSILAFKGDKILLLREFRMAVNRYVYNFCAGRKEVGETLQETLERELYEETGLKLKRIVDILPPVFAAVAISDIKTNVVVCEVEGEITSQHNSANEEIKAAFYNVDELKEIIRNGEAASRAQMAMYFFIKAKEAGIDNFLANGIL